MMTPKSFRPVAGLALVSILMLFSFGCGNADPVSGGGGGKPNPVVAVEVARREALTRTLSLTGETVAVESVVVSATVEGPIGFCPWREGDYVKSSPDAPARLVEIDRELYRAEVRAAEAALGVAEAKLTDMRSGTRPEEIAKAAEEVRRLTESTTFARSDLDRITKLVESGSLAGEVLEKARVEHVAEKSRLDAAQGHLRMLETGYTETEIAVQDAVVAEVAAKLDLANARLSECVVRAPFAGTITRVFVRQGDLASPKTPLLEITDLGSLVIRLAVPEANAAEVKPGLEAQVRLDALPGRVLPGTVVRVFPDLDRRMRTRTVEVRVPDPAELLPGMFARVELRLGVVPDALTVPLAAVVRTPSGEDVVWVLADGRVSARKVRTGMRAGGRVEVVEGVGEGDKVVVSGQGKLREGAEVRVATTPPGAGGTGR